MSTIKHRRGQFEVSPAFAQANEPYLQATHEVLETERWRLLNQSNTRRLRPEEHVALAAVTNVINVHRALDVFDDVHHSNLGYDYADQLHGALGGWACGCQIHYAFDHHDYVAGRPQVRKPHRSEFHCKDHAHLTDVHEHHKALNG